MCRRSDERTTRAGRSANSVWPWHLAKTLALHLHSIIQDTPALNWGEVGAGKKHVLGTINPSQRPKSISLVNHQ